MTIHPATQIVLWIGLVLLAQYWPLPVLIGATFIVVGVGLWLDSQQLRRLLLRIRWIALTILAIYAYTTPGAAWIASAGLLSPTYEGMADGMVQLARLLCALSGLAILLVMLSREQFIAGVYYLARPLQFLGVSRVKLAARLALTLSYAEDSMRETATDWRFAIERSMQPERRGMEEIVLPDQSMGWQDLFLLAALCVIGVWV